MKNLKNEKGLSLIEVVASITLFAIISVSFYGFFINSAKFSSSNDGQIQASSIARSYSSNIDDFQLSEFTLKMEEINLIQKEIYIKTEKNEEYFVKISINKDPEVLQNTSYKNELRKSLIQVWKYVDNSESSYQGKPVLAESFSYHKSRGGH